jgi:hypothetical protein
VPKFHDNQLILLTSDELNELVTQVRQAPEMEPVFRLGKLARSTRPRKLPLQLRGSVNPRCKAT